MSSAAPPHPAAAVIAPAKKPRFHKAVRLCDCGTPAVEQRIFQHYNALKYGCARCLAEESRTRRETTGHSTRATVWDIPRHQLDRIRTACDAWLTARGIRPDTGHHYVG